MAVVTASPGTDIPTTHPSRSTLSLLVGVDTTSARIAGEAGAERRGASVAILETDRW